MPRQQINEVYQCYHCEIVETYVFYLRMTIYRINYTIFVNELY